VGLSNLDVAAEDEQDQDNIKEGEQGDEDIRRDIQKRTALAE